MTEQSRLNQLIQFLEESPDDSFLKFALAKEYEKMDRDDKALKHYLDIRAKDPEYIGLYYHLGHLYEHIGEPHQALKVYEEGIILAKKKVDFHSLSELNNAKVNLEMTFNN